MDGNVLGRFEGSARQRRLGADAARWVGQGWSVLRVWLDRRRQRHHLARLDPRLLKDIGISQADALEEARKPFWQG